MNYKIIIVKEAKTDLKESINWYNDINPKLANRFITSFKKSLTIIKSNPLNFQIRYDDVRIIMLNTFPYLIHFTVIENLIIVKAVFHSSRDSKLNIFKS